MKLCKAMVQLVVLTGILSTTESQGAFKDSTPGKKCKELFHCSGLGNNCQLRQGKDGCSTCFCADACPEIFCGTHCRRVLTEGHCPFCDCRRGQQIYIKGVKPSPQPYTLAPYTRPFDINEKQEFE